MRDADGFAPAEMKREPFMRRTRVGPVLLSAALFAGLGLWLVPHGAGRYELGQSGAQMALSAVYPVIGAAFLVVTGALAFQEFLNDPRGGRPASATAPRRPAAFDYVNR